MESRLRRAGRAFALTLHGTLAVELGSLVVDPRAFERFWRRPRRTGLALALKALGLGLCAATVAGASAGWAAGHTSR